MFTASGLIVRFLKVFEKSNYHSIKWVRYLTKASGTYQIRVSWFSSISDCLSLLFLHPSSDGGDGDLFSHHSTMLGCVTWSGCVGIMAFALASLTSV